MLTIETMKYFTVKVSLATMLYWLVAVSLVVMLFKVVPIEQFVLILALIGMAFMQRERGLSVKKDHLALRDGQALQRLMKNNFFLLNTLSGLVVQIRKLCTLMNQDQKKFSAKCAKRSNNSLSPNSSRVKRKPSVNKCSVKSNCVYKKPVVTSTSTVSCGQTKQGSTVGKSDIGSNTEMLYRKICLDCAQVMTQVGEPIGSNLCQACKPSTGKSLTYFQFLTKYNGTIEFFCGCQSCLNGDTADCLKDYCTLCTVPKFKMTRV